MFMKSLDRIDIRILSTLQGNGRISNKDLAEQVNLSTSACHQRLQRLMDEDWLLGIQGVVNIDKLAAPVQCLATISMSCHAPESFALVEKQLERMPEVLEAYTVSGGCDFIVRFACAQMSRYMDLTNELIHYCPDIGHINTHVVLKQSKRFQGFTLPSP